LYGVAGIFALLFAIVQSGKVGPLSARVRGLFVPHTRTGNPLVDSVAEHQATQGDVYFKFFHFNIFTGAVGMVMCVFHKRSPARLFVAAYFFVAMYFSSKMVRLVLLLGPACAAASAVALAALYEWIADEAMTVMEAIDPERKRAAEQAAAKAKEAEGNGSRAARRAEKKGFGKPTKHFRISDTPAYMAKWFRENPDARKAIAAIAFAVCFSIGTSFLNRSWMMAKGMSEPSIMMRARNRDGSIVMLDDFRESYWWLKDNTPEDSRIMAWWDYGYQINGLGNRTTVADGNTWNHEHIALLGKCLVSPELEGHHIVRHLADYVLVWTTRFAGFHGDDLAKAPHMARIAGSVYKDVHPTDFYVDEMGRPSDYMRQSLLYRLHSYGKATDVEPLEKYEEVFQSKNSMVRIWKVLEVDEESKEYVRSGANRRCDAGGWYCPGVYPEALEDVLKGKVDYQQ
jgi:dolichyl-diphosphooligosaccharide--protein glycosyltransferase